MRSLLTAQHRLSVYDGVDWGELYDLEADPDELHNLWGEPAAAPLRAQLTEQMVRAMIALSDTSPVPSRIA
jgi:arylsulfatase